MVIVDMTNSKDRGRGRWDGQKYRWKKDVVTEGRMENAYDTEFELEEGEVLEGRTANFIDIGDLDRRVELVLGHHRKDFEGLFHQKKSGPKFGCYGTFCPTRNREDPSPAVGLLSRSHILPMKGTTVKRTMVSFVGPHSPDSPNRTPSSIICVMTSHELPHGGLLSPSLPPLLFEQFEQKERSVLIKRHDQKKTASAPSVNKSDTASTATKIDGTIGRAEKSIQEKEKVSKRAKATPMDLRAPAGKSLNVADRGADKGDIKRKRDTEDDDMRLKKLIKQARRVMQDSNVGQAEAHSGPSKADGASGFIGSSSSWKAGLVNGGTSYCRVDRALKKGTDEEAFQKGGGAGPFGLNGNVNTSFGSSKKNHAVILGLVKEAREIKHKADRLSTMSNKGEGTALYLWSALKFLEAASAHQEGMTAFKGVSQAEIARSTDLYNDTARLCNFCAAEYEKQRDLATAALSYICAALARFRATVSKVQSLSKDCTELQSAATSTTCTASRSHALPALPLPREASPDFKTPGPFLGAHTAIGQSPSSSTTSDLDNQNHPVFANDKGLADTYMLVKGTTLQTSPWSSSGTADDIPQQLHKNFHGMLCTGLDVLVMVESWTKAHNAIHAAETACVGNSEGIVAVKKVGEMGFFGDIDFIVKLARRALHTLGH